VAPTTPLEAELCRIWEELLVVDEVGIQDDFIALGGDSLHVGQLLARVAELPEVNAADVEELPACSILWAPTVERLAALLEQGWQPRGGAVAVEPGRQGKPFFFFPAHDWGTVGLGALSRRMESEYALHTFQLEPGTLGEEIASVESLGARFAQEIRMAQPEGPYALGGICFGAAIALEVARRLERDGEPVTLALVNPIGERPGRVRNGVRWIVFAARSGTLRSWLRRRTRQRRGEGGSQPWPSVALGVDRALESASTGYKARPYPGRVAVLAGADYTTPKRFWDGVAAGGLEWRQIPHGSAAVFRTRHLDALAAELDAVLAGD
jgi:hypothetical protein